MNYNINQGRWGDVFAVPRAVVEDYIKLASGGALKVLLYMLCKNAAVTTEVLMGELKLSKEDIEDAFRFWEQVGLLSDESIPTVQVSRSITETPKASEAIEVLEVPEVPKTPIVKASPSKATLTPREIAERIESSEEISFLFQTAESSSGSLLTHTQQRSLIWLHDYLGLPVDVIIMLMDYCENIGKTAVRYMEQVALTWQEKDIFTVEAAEKEIENQREWHSFSARVMSAFGISRKLSSKEEGFIAEWTVKKYDLDLISYAYDKTIDSINKLSFPYINKILMGWADKGLRSREEIDSMNEAAPKDGKHSYDIDKFDSFAI